jgi:RNA polymerase sigma factor (sigma-70 family)
MNSSKPPISERSRGETARIESCLARFEEDPDGAFDELAELAYDRLRRLAAHILNQDFSDLHGQTDDAYHNALLKLRTSLRHEQVAPQTMQELNGLVALQVRRALTDLVKRYRRDARHMGVADGQDSGEQINVPAEQSTFDPARLAAWTEFQNSIENLEPTLREVVELRLYNGLSHQEAATVLGVPLTTVQWRWRSARVELALAGSDLLPD